MQQVRIWETEADRKLPSGDPSRVLMADNAT